MGDGTLPWPWRQTPAGFLLMRRHTHYDNWQQAGPQPIFIFTDQNGGTPQENGSLWNIWYIFFLIFAIKNKRTEEKSPSKNLLSKITWKPSLQCDPIRNTVIFPEIQRKAKSVDPNKLASSEASWSVSTFLQQLKMQENHYGSRAKW